MPIRPSWPCLAILVAVLVGAPGAGGAAGADLWGARGDAIRTDLRAIRNRVAREPRVSGYDLDRAARRLSTLRAEAPRDPEVFHLQREVRDLRWQADRAARRAALGQAPGLPGPAFGTAAATGALRQPAATDLRGEVLPIGTGTRLILIQNGLRQAAAALDGGQVDLARRALADARADLAGVTTALGASGADDPNLIALGLEADRLATRLGAVASPPG